MADFYQHARLPTLHHLSTPDEQERLAELEELAQARPVALLLPALAVECARPALPAILEQVANVPYITTVVLSMNGMKEEDLGRVSGLCRETMPRKQVHVLWNDGPEMQRILESLAAADLGAHEAGKGTNIWTGLAYLQALGHRGIVVSHDTDILNYSSQLLARLSYPLLHARMTYKFAKGYYSRVAGRLYGRVTRLLIFPLIQAFQEVLGAQPLLAHLEAFRYPLSGEFAGDLDTLSRFNLPSGWGLEVAMLCELHRQLTPDQQCQVDLGFHYEHRHRQLTHGSHAIEHGLVKAAMEVVRCLAWQVLQEAEDRAAASLLKLVLERYRPRAQEWMERYEHVALINGLHFDRDEEAAAVAAFTEALDSLRHSMQDGQPANLRLHSMRAPTSQAFATLPGLASQLQSVALRP